MLRLVLLLLILANGLFWAWREGGLSAIGMAPTSQREPQRLQLQVAADLVRVLPAGSVAPSTKPLPNTVPALDTPASAAASAVAASGAQSTLSASCMQTPLLSTAAADAAETALANALPAKPWQRVSAAPSLPFMVAMTGLGGAALQTKQRELARLSINTEPLTTPSGAPAGGLVLGRYNDQAQANAALAGWTKRGVRTARVVSVADAGSVRLRIDPVSDDVAASLRGWNAQAGEATAFKSCSGV
jgi:hypothetical protein